MCKVFEELVTQQVALEVHNAKAEEMATLSGRRERGETALRKVKPFADKHAEAEASYTKAHADLEFARYDMESAELALKRAEKVIAELAPLEKAESLFDKLKQKCRMHPTNE